MHAGQYIIESPTRNWTLTCNVLAVTSAKGHFQLVPGRQTYTAGRAAMYGADPGCAGAC